MNALRLPLRLALGSLLLASTVACSGDPVTRVEITATGDTGKYKAPLCVEVLWTAVNSTYTLAACSADVIQGSISTVLVGEPLDAAADSFERLGNAYMYYSSDSFVGNITSVSEPEIDGSVAKINLSVTFEAGDSGQGGGFSGL
jgi:hypothetical protein